MKTFRVVATEEEYSADVRAHEFLIGREGSLIFYVNNKPRRAYAPGQWRNVAEVVAA